MNQYITQSMDVSPGPGDRTVRLSTGEVIEVPGNWRLLPPGDAGVTRRVKAAGPSWTVKEKKGRRTFSRGVWACGDQIDRALHSMRATRQDPAYAKKQAAAKKARDRKQQEYVDDFFSAVVRFLGFHERYESIAARFAAAVTEHATPVGSGTVARTQRIPINQRAESAVIAWMRHQTTAYDEMTIARVKGERREVRRQLAVQSRKLLKKYRTGQEDALVGCPLARALRKV